MTLMLVEKRIRRMGRRR